MRKIKSNLGQSSQTRSQSDSKVVFIVIVLSMILTLQLAFVNVMIMTWRVMTSHVEEEDEEAGPRKKTKRNFEDYVLGMLLW